MSNWRHCWWKLRQLCGTTHNWHYLWTALRLSLHHALYQKSVRVIYQTLNLQNLNIGGGGNWYTVYTRRLHILRWDAMMRWPHNMLCFQVWHWQRQGHYNSHQSSRSWYARWRTVCPGCPKGPSIWRWLFMCDTLVLLFSFCSWRLRMAALCPWTMHPHVVGMMSLDPQASWTAQALTLTASGCSLHQRDSRSRLSSTNSP